MWGKKYIKCADSYGNYWIPSTNSDSIKRLVKFWTYTTVKSLINRIKSTVLQTTKKGIISNQNKSKLYIRSTAFKQHDSQHVVLASIFCFSFKAPIYFFFIFCLKESSPKRKILSSITHHCVIQTCMSFFLLLSTKEDILKNVSNQTIDGSHWLPCYCFLLCKAMATVNSTVQNDSDEKTAVKKAVNVVLHKLFPEDFHITSTYYIITNSNLKVLTSQRKLFWKCLLDKWFWTFKTNSKQTFYCLTPVHCSILLEVYWSIYSPTHALKKLFCK